jgi:hypothetical protein
VLVVAETVVPDPWEWGWDSLVALGTIGLAFVTLLLAVASFLTARAAAQDVRADWRPVIVPASDVEVDWASNQDLVILRIRNIGQGGAYDVDAALGTDDRYTPASLFVPGEPNPINFTVVPPGDTMELYFGEIDTKPRKGELVIDYADLNGRRYGSRIEIRETTAYLPRQEFPVLRMAQVTHSEGKVVVPYNDPRNYGRRRLIRMSLNRIRRKLGRKPR